MGSKTGVTNPILVPEEEHLCPGQLPLQHLALLQLLGGAEGLLHQVIALLAAHRPHPSLGPLYSAFPDFPFRYSAYQIGRYY